MYVYIPQASLVLVDVQREHQIFETRLEDTSEKLCGFLWTQVICKNKVLLTAESFLRTLNKNLKIFLIMHDYKPK